MSRHSSLVNELRELAAHPPSDTKERNELLKALRDAAYAVETPIDTLFRVCYGGLQACVAKTVGDMSLFELLASQKKPISLEDLSKHAHAEPRLTRRLLRYCVEHGMLEEPESMQYLSNERTKTLALPGVQAGLGHLLEVQGPAWLCLPSFLNDRGYDNIVSATDCPFQVAHNTKLSSFLWAAAQGPHMPQRSGKFFSGLRDLSLRWLDGFPTHYLTSAVGEAPVFVDVGGGVGHVCADLVQSLPELAKSRRIILQDLPHMTSKSLSIPGVEAQSYDFFTPQPIKNASFYYIKSCLHDWPDEKAIEILKNQVPAMGSESVILIDEIVLPERGASFRSVQYDVSIMAAAAGGERTEKEWAHIFRQAGLAVRETHYYDDELLAAVQILVKS